MLSLSGNVKGKMFKDELVSPQELMKLFDIPEKILEREVVFEIDKRYCKKDRFGIVKHPRGINLECKAIGRHNGASVVLTYFENENFTDTGRSIKLPKKIHEFRTRFIQMNPENDLEKLVFYYLHPTSGTSPLHDKRKSSHFVYVDQEERAKESLQTERDHYDLYRLIFEERNVVKLRRKARGITVKGERVSNVEKLDVAGLQDALIKLARKHPTKFKAAYEDAETDIRGFVSEAISYGIVVKRGAGGGKMELKFAEEYGGDKITMVDKTANINNVLYSLVMSDFDNLGKRLKRDADNFSSKMKANTLKELGELDAPEVKEEMTPFSVEKIKSAEPKELAAMALQLDAVYIDAIQGNIHWMNRMGKPEKKPFIVGYGEDAEKAIESAITKTEAHKGKLRSMLKHFNNKQIA